MKLLPTTAGSSFAVQNFFIMVGAVLLPALIILLIWVIFFKDRRRRKRRRRRESPGAHQPLARSGGLPPLRRPEDFTDQPKS